MSQEVQQFFVGYTGAPGKLDFAAPIVNAHTPAALNFRNDIWDKNVVPGQRIYMSDADLIQNGFWDSANSRPPGGTWMTVRVAGTVTQAIVRGAVAFWDGTDASLQSKTVTPTYSANAIPVGLFTVSRTADNQDFVTTIRPFNGIGRAYGKFHSTVTNTSGTPGDLVVVVDGGSGLGALDVIADNTALTSANARNVIGQVVEAVPSASAVVVIGIAPLTVNAFM